MHAESLLRVCLYRKGAMEGEKRGFGNVRFRWWRKPEYPEKNYRPAAGY